LVEYHAGHIQAYTHGAAAPDPEAKPDANAKPYTGASDWRVQPDPFRPAN
jgi:hypothetical protein